MAKTVQLNFQVSAGLANKVRSDARHNNKSLDAVGATILADFFRAFSRSERAKFYQHAPNKRSGRRVGGAPKKR